jgi:hypothetical protein
VRLHDWPVVTPQRIVRANLLFPNKSSTDTHSPLTTHSPSRHLQLFISPSLNLLSTIPSLRTQHSCHLTRLDCPFPHAVVDGLLPHPPIDTMVVPQTSRGSYGPEHEGKEAARLEEDRTRDKVPHPSQLPNANADLVLEKYCSWRCCRPGAA